MNRTVPLYYPYCSRTKTQRPGLSSASSK